MSLDRLEVTPFVVIVGRILQDRMSGYLTVLKPPMRKVLYWAHGDLVMAVSSVPEDSLAELLVRRGVVDLGRAAKLFAGDPNETVARAHESGLLDLSGRQTVLRDWLSMQIRPLFDLEEGTAAFTDDEPLSPDRRVFLQSTPAVVVDGVRAIANGMVLRRSLGDLQREIHPARESRFTLESLPLTDQERAIAEDVRAPVTIDAFLKRHLAASVVAAKIVISMLAVGVFAVFERSRAVADEVDMQRDLELLAAIGASDTRTLRAVAFSRQLATLDHYQVLDVARASTRAQINTAVDILKKRYDPATFPPAARDAIQTIVIRVDEAASVLKDPARRGAYDRLIQSHRGEGAAVIQQELTRHSIAEQNYTRAKALVAAADYYGAIVLLRQSVRFKPDFAEAWALLGACQERNPRWRRDAAESYQRSLSIDPSNADVMISLGDMYRGEGLITRAQTCYEDALKTQPENSEALSRLERLKKG